MFKSYKEEAYNFIRNGILAGDIPPGARLSDIALSRQMKISRTPIREALNQLVSENLATQIPHYGMFVRTMERQELEELYDLRELLEGYAAFQAAKKRMPEHIKEMRALLNQLQEINNEFFNSSHSDIEDKLAEQQIQCDAKFHSVIMKAASSSKLYKIVEDMHLLTHIFGYKRFIPGIDVPKVLIRTCNEHESILKSIENQDGESARSLMCLHVSLGKKQGMDSFDYHRADLKREVAE